ncbi:DUF1840 domain-containing protein [Legionella brunensis]|uniref:DUF1840 domain-containing protein n=1 Tax=Legionella brunensis TaxID=29422 RepID=A0A0W0SDV7_9GAMM|nr:DUF1840 domain-containing protein [Legionella brunensis]KTC81554.1 hypothetical protein Lbru_2074 [Legionella brunensis]
MLVTFYSDAYENIVMFGHIAQHLLKLMGHSGTVPGAIVAEEVPEALSRLQSSIEENPQQGSASKPRDNDEDEPEVSLAHRALPLVNMLKAASKAQCNIMWR